MERTPFAYVPPARRRLRGGTRALALSLLLVLPARFAGARGGPGPGQPVWPQPGQTDEALFEKAQRIQSRMWWHLSPEGLLVERHRIPATPETLDHDVLASSDAAIWTGCYVASQVCRWSVTRDPDAMTELEHLAHGLEALSTVTGVPGRIARNVGRPYRGRPEWRAIASPTGDGRWFRPDVSRDQLAGLTLGWTWIGRYLPEAPDLQALAARQLAQIARRLWADGMWLRDYQGKPTDHGELRPTLRFPPGVKNGVEAAIGLATILAAAELNPDAQDLRSMVVQMDRDEWDDALDHQFTFFSNQLTSSNVNMTALALLVLARCPHPNANYRARRGLDKLRAATVGWWNAGVDACVLLGGVQNDRDQTIGDIRAALHAMPEEEALPLHVEMVHKNEIVPIAYRTRYSSWAWKEDIESGNLADPNGPSVPHMTVTRADWLFAYWLARAAAVLAPRTGPGADPTAHPVAMDLPPWLREAAAPPDANAGR